MGRKRKSSSLIPHHKGRVPPCRICEAPGTGFHYGVNTCEACKGFFHRSLGQHIHYRCEKVNKCPINFKTTKFCQKCRYDKCLASGMCKSASKTGRYPSCKITEDILELKRLEKAHARSQHSKTDLKSRLEAGSDTEASPAKQPRPSLENDVDALPDSTGLSLIHVPSGPKHTNSLLCDSSPQSDNSALQSSSAASSPINLSLTSYEATPSNHFSSPSLSSPVSIANNCRSSLDTTASEIRSFQSSQSTPHKASNVWQKTDPSGMPDSMIHYPCKHSSSLLAPSSHNKNITTHIPSCSPPLIGAHESLTVHSTSCGLNPRNQSSTSFPWSHIPLPESPIKVQGISQAVSSATPDLSFGELTELVPVSASPSDIKTSTELPDLDSISVVDHSTAMILEKLDELYADSDKVVRKLLEVESRTLRDKNRDLSPTEILTEQLKHKEACLRRAEMFGRKKFLEESEYEDVLKETGLDADGRQQYVSRKFKCLENTIINIAVFAKSVPGFKFIPLHQMVRLIKYARWEISMLASHKSTNSDLAVSISRTHGWICPLDYDETSSKAFVYPCMHLMGRLKKEELTDEELVVVIGMALLAPDRPEPTDSPVIRCIHSHLVNILLKLLKQNHKEPLKVFAAIVSFITEARSMEVLASAVYLKDLQKIVSSELRVRPMVQEMMTGICFKPK